MSLRAAVILLIASLLALPTPIYLLAEEAVIHPDLLKNIDRSLAFIQSQQKPDGSFEAAGPGNTITGLAVLSYLSAGHAPELGRYGPTLRRAIDHLVDKDPEGGYFGGDGGRMYSHCIVTIALAQAHGLELDETQRKKVRNALQKALAVICTAQDVERTDKHSGGWHSDPTSADSDLSVTAWCIVALRACQDAGLTVPQARLDRALDYLLRCHRDGRGAFAHAGREDLTAGVNAAAVLCLAQHGRTELPQTASAIKYLENHLVKDSNQPYYYFTQHQIAQASALVGGETWPKAWNQISRQLLKSQRKDGSFPHARHNEPGADNDSGRVYSTAMAALTLTIPLRLLPLYQH